MPIIHLLHNNNTNGTMNLCRFSVGLLFICFQITITSGSNEPTHTTGDVSINCGSTGTYAARSTREWLGDVRSRFSSGLEISGSSTFSTVVHSWASADPIPHQTARLSRSKFSYSFQVNAGQKVIRLHFNPTTYRGFKGLKDLFTVEAGSFTLLSNFSASITAEALGVNTFAKDFCLDIPENQRLNIVFSAESSPSYSLDTYAFINGIEIISVPASLSYFPGGDIGLHVVGQKSLVYVDSSIALEIVHHISIKQDLVSSADGSSDMFAMWLTAPKQKLDNINNITWKLPVDVGFRYLVRLHFSEICLNMAKSVGLNFKVLINEMVVSTDSDMVKEMDGSVPWYGDYVVMLNGRKQEGKRDLLICLQSNQEFMDMHGPLKGFEILKLSNPDSSLAAPNPLPPAQDSPLQAFQPSFMILGRRNAIMTIAIAVISLVNIIVHQLLESWGSWEASSSEEENKPSAGAKRVCRRFLLAEIQLATRNFNDGLIIGKGGFGKVYRGLIDNGQKAVAVKRLKPNSRQGAHEFLTEIETLSKIRHINVVSLIGYCQEHREMILVYEHMARGSLADHLYKLPKDSSNCFCFTWKQRLNICIGVARGLEYLHTGCGIIHRDLKASNILLDESFVAKLSDFGLAKPEHRNKLQSHVSTKVKGTFGYVDPYYVTTSKLRRKSDTYSFGVVLLELLCGRRAVDSEVLDDEKILLTKWAQDKISKGEVDQIIASSLRDEISPNSLKTFVGIAGRCLNDDPKNRPTMSEVVLQLEFALKQQESNQNLVLNEIASVSVDLRPSTSNDRIDVPRAAQPIITTTKMQNLRLPLDKQTSGRIENGELTSGRKQWTRFTTNKVLRFRPWQAFRKRVKPSKKNELLFQDPAVGHLHYDFARITAATDDFSHANIVGRGGFGSVYKGKLLNGQEIAVKRLSSSSRQGSIEFINEILILARLLHRNLVKLLGFCQEGNERLLIYEFVENSSLDLFIFDSIKRSFLDWDRRYKIILGTAMGLHYLHEGSELRIIHRDLKASNVLLDGDLNPKVADFGIARVLKADDSPNTSLIVGTHGYMAPEYAMHGICSVKSDVFSFGVLVLEILSGQRNKDLMNLTWKNWHEGTAENMIDPTLRARTDSLHVMLRCMHIGLLCIQESPASRPTMNSVTLMLGVSDTTLPAPSAPVSYMVSEEYRLTNTNYRQPEAAASKISSNNDMSDTELSPR